MSSLQQNLSLKQRLKINPKQIQFLNFLYFNQTELEAQIEQELLENPFLEKESNEVLQADTALQGEDLNDTMAVAEMPAEEMFNAADIDEEVPDYKVSQPTSPEANDWKDRQIINTTVEKDYKAYYVEQVGFLPLTEEELELSEFIIYSTQDDGLLHMNIEELTDEISFSKGSFYSEKKIARIKKAINNLEPAGYACYDLQDYLLCKLRRTKSNSKIIRKMARIVIRDYFKSFVNKDFEKITKETAIREEDLLRVIDLVQSFPPQSISGMDIQEPANYTIIPDYRVFYEAGNLKGELANQSYAGFKVNEKYAKVVADGSGKKSKKFVSEKLESAHWFKDAIQQRIDTMTKVIETIVYLQGDYLKTGDLKALKPMILKDVAKLIGMEISTVSRVTSEKYADTPIGVINLKDLFTEAIPLKNGSMVSNLEVQQWVAETIEAENKQSPLSDNDVRLILEDEKGLLIGRRTVAKYRIDAGIPSGKRRREV